MPHDPKRRKIGEASSEAGLNREDILSYIRHEWIVVEHPYLPEPELELDEEDIARIRLILSLQREFGVNDEGIDIILHLLDQMHALRSLVLRKAA